MKSHEITNLVVFGVAWFHYLSGFREGESVSLPLLVISIAGYVGVLLGQFARAKREASL